MFELTPKMIQMLRQKSGLGSQPTKVALPATPRSRTQAPMMMEDYLNYGTGPARNFYTTNGAGSMTTSPLASTDALVSKASKQLGDLGARFAEGGKVSVPINAMKAIKEALNHVQNKDRRRAVETLRNSREAIGLPDAQSAAAALLDPRSSAGGDWLRKMIQDNSNQTRVPLLADGGEVPMDPGMGGQQMGGQTMGNADPQQLYAQYQQLVQVLESGQLDQQQEMQAVQQLQMIEQALEAMGVDVDAAQGAQQEQGPDLQSMMQQLTAGSAGVQ